MTAHLHDGVLQTLALIQLHADDQQTVFSLARQQERELREWLYQERTTSDRSGQRRFEADRSACGVARMASRSRW